METEREQKRVVEAEAKLAQARTAEEREDAANELAEARSDLRGIESAQSMLNVGSDLRSKDPAAPGRSQTSYVPWATVLERIGLEQSQTHPTFARIARQAAENPDLTHYKLKSSAYKFAFMLVPISLPFLLVMFFWRKGITMYDHTIFTLYGLSFLSLWWALIALMASNDVTEGFAGRHCCFSRCISSCSSKIPMCSAGLQRFGALSRCW